MFSKLLLVFLIVYLLPNFSYGQRDKRFFRNDYTYLENMDSFYKVHIIPQTFSDAKRMCELEGASMFYPNNSDEAQAVISFWNKTLPHIPWLFVGLTDVMAEGFFETIDHRPISEVYSQFHRNQPDNSGGNENCVHMDLQAKMNDYRCDVKTYFICKKERSTLYWDDKCDTHYFDYTYNAEFGKCYKVHTSPLKWAEAYSVCRAEQTSLAMAGTEMEADYLANLTEFSSIPRFEGKYQRGIYHLGFHNRFNEGWQTLNGFPELVVLAFWFDYYRPSNNDQDCGAMFFNGRLITTDCDAKSLFICEKYISKTP